MIRKRYTEQETLWLKNNYSLLGPTKCSLKLDRSPNLVIQKARSLGLRFHQKLPNPTNENNKICAKCHTEKPKFEFYRNRHNKDGYCPNCKSCEILKYDSTERSKKYKRLKNLHCSSPETKRVYYIKQILKGARTRAKEKSLSFSLTLEWALKNAGTHCPILGTEYVYGGIHPSKANLSIDRINPNKGYDEDNCVFISHRANAIKNDATIEELKKILSFYENMVASARFKLT